MAELRVGDQVHEQGGLRLGGALFVQAEEESEESSGSSGGSSSSQAVVAAATGAQAPITRTIDYRALVLAVAGPDPRTADTYRFRGRTFKEPFRRNRV